MANHTTRTPKKDEIFMAELTLHGTVSAACHIAGYGRRQLYQWRKDDQDFALAWDEALATYTELLEQEADRRAVEGTLKPVFYLGEKCGEIRHYSDTLLMFRLKALKPEMYRDAPKHQVTVAAPEPVEGGATVHDLLQRIRTEVYNLDAEV